MGVALLHLFGAFFRALNRHRKSGALPWPGIRCLADSASAPRVRPMTSTRLQNAESPSERLVPLVVDLDGTLVCSDLLTEYVFALAKQRPWRLLRLPFWLAQGKARLKRHLAQEAQLDVHTLPYHRGLLAYLQAQKRRGRHLILATAADETVAQQVARETGVFDAVFASDGTTNLSGKRKRQRLVTEFGARGFDYAGNSRRDLPVWGAARRAILVRPSRGLPDAVAEISEVERVFADGVSGPRLYLHALRVHHWLKNILVFVPLVAAHQLNDMGLLAHAVLAFIAFSLCASSVYLLNDLVDLPTDRRHPYKKERPLASGQLPIGQAVGLIPLLWMATVAVGLQLPRPFLWVLGLYYVFMLAYCLRLKDFAIMDALVLAGGYALRVLAGSVAVTITASPWLLGCSILLFFSLALLKRYAELVTMRSLEGAKARARGYSAKDSRLVATLGGSSAFLAVIVLALYAGIEQRLHPRYELLWLVCVLLSCWIGYMWLMAHRGRIRDDPAAFALKDRASQVLAVLIMTTVLIAA